MPGQRILTLAWQACKFLSGLAAWLYLRGHFTGSSDTTTWISRAGCALMLLGGLGNVVVVVLKRGYMPVRVGEIHGRQRFSYEPIHSGTRLWFLGDCIRLGAYFTSPGDLLLYGGFALMMGVCSLPGM